MELNKEIIPAVSVHLGLKEGKAQILVEADLEKLALDEAGKVGSPALKAILGFVGLLVKQIP